MSPSRSKRKRLAVQKDAYSCPTCDREADHVICVQCLEERLHRAYEEGFCDGQDSHRDTD